MEDSVDQESIVAIATPAGRGGIGILRISGTSIDPICYGILGRIPLPRLATYLPFFDDQGSIIDEGIAIYFPSPFSFTGENVLELHAHGGRVVLDLLMARILGLGARPARPGEYSERAFLNGKIDLIQAEAVADLIEAGTVQAVRSARRAMDGAFSERVNALLEQLIQLRTHIEAGIDFSEEDIEFLPQGIVHQELLGLQNSLNNLLSIARQGRLLREGMNLVIAGKPNSGKSSLLNALTKRETAIVTPLPGTTRDVLRETIEIDGMPVHVIDTAGLRKSDDPIEQEGVRRAHLEIEKADRILWLIDASKPEADQVEDEWLFDRSKVTKVFNKIDITGDPSVCLETDDCTEIFLSVKSGEGMGLLYRHLKDSMGYDEHLEDVFIARQRHLDALNRTASFVRSALLQLTDFKMPELLAEELRLAQRCLSEITGAYTTDDLLGRIFSSFCVGK